MFIVQGGKEACSDNEVVLRRREEPFEDTPHFGITNDSMDISLTDGTQSCYQLGIETSLESTSGLDEDGNFLQKTLLRYSVGEEVEHRCLKRANPLFDEDGDGIYSIQSCDVMTKRRRISYEMIRTIDDDFKNDCWSSEDDNMDDFSLPGQKGEIGSKLNLNKMPDARKYLPSVLSAPEAIHMRQVSLEEAPCISKK